jgi:membrane fusion protein, copper/silver efflux system
MRKNSITIIAAVLIIMAVAGAYFIGLHSGMGMHKSATESPQNSEKNISHWTCSMHPDINQPGPGQCPICQMDLVPVYEEGREEGERELVMSETGMKLAEIQTAPVERKPVTTEVRMIGKVDFDETGFGYITAWVGGRIDRLYVDYTNIKVNKGEHMAQLYSTELIETQKALLAALKTSQELPEGKVDSLVESNRERLRLWGLTDDQIAEIEKRGEPQELVTITSPMTGIVIQKNAVEGMYVKTGTRIYTIADLEKVWVKLEAYESEMALLKYGQQVEFETEAYPGKVFTGTISFIDPVLNEKTRTAALRVSIENPDGILKPGMFVRAKVLAKLGADGTAIGEDLAGKWVGSMHPEIIKDGPGTCDICGMPLVPIESTDLVDTGESKGPPLVIPATAPLITGKRAVVYVHLTDREKPTFEGREIVLGPRAGDYYIVLSGLEEGEMVVTNGSFKIDSSLQIKAKPSMMSPKGGAVPPAHHHGGEVPIETHPAHKKAQILSLSDDAWMRRTYRNNL